MDNDVDIGFAHEVCAACGAAAMKPSGLLAEHSGRTYSIGRCEACGSRSSVPIPTKDIVARFYAEEFSYAWYRLHAAGKRRDARERVSELGTLLRGRVLDLGGGMGYMSEVLHARGIDAVVYDPYADGGAVRPPDGSFNVVVALHVLEHVPDPLSFLRAASRFLVPGGILIMAVPNAAGIGYRSKGMRWVWAQPPVLHLHHFTAQGLSSLLQRAGFTDVRCTFHERWDANSVSDLGVTPSSWFIGFLARVPHFRRYGIVRRFAARFDIWRRFRHLAVARRRGQAEADLAEILVVGIVGPHS